MRTIICYIATSLYGYIADDDGGVDWLENIPDPDTSDYGYADFYDRIDTVLLGRTTYDQVRSFDVDYPYPDKNNYIFSRRPFQSEEEYIKGVTDAVPFVRALKQEEGKDIWLVGGASLFHSLFEAGLVDALHLHIMPIVLGSGIPLFQTSSNQKLLKHIDVKNYTSGVVQVEYLINFEL